MKWVGSQFLEPLKAKSARLARVLWSVLASGRATMGEARCHTHTGRPDRAAD